MKKLNKQIYQFFFFLRKKRNINKNKNIFLTFEAYIFLLTSVKI
jgi:hypothetical protein